MQDVGVSRPAPCLSRPSHASRAVGLPPPRHGRVRCSGAQAATRRGAWKEWEWGRVCVLRRLWARKQAPDHPASASERARKKKAPLRACDGLGKVRARSARSACAHTSSRAVRHLAPPRAPPCGRCAGFRRRPPPGAPASAAAAPRAAPGAPHAPPWFALPLPRATSPTKQTNKQKGASRAARPAPREGAPARALRPLLQSP